MSAFSTPRPSVGWASVGTSRRDVMAWVAANVEFVGAWVRYRASRTSVTTGQFRLAGGCRRRCDASCETVVRDSA